MGTLKTGAKALGGALRERESIFKRARETLLETGVISSAYVYVCIYCSMRTPSLGEEEEEEEVLLKAKG